MNCRTLDPTCDEKKPICGGCRRKGVDCNATDFIVHDRRSTASKLDEEKHDQGLRDSETSTEPATQNLESTYDVFRQAPPTTLPEPLGKSQTFDSPEIIVTEQALDLVRIYQSGIGSWMDVCDNPLSYQRQVVRLAFLSDLLLNSICALSAKQMSLVRERSFWEPVAARYYCESLRLLIQNLNQPETAHDVVLTATILLCSYELLANPGPDYKKHLYGVSTLIQTRGVVFEGTSLERASFWIYARQDVAVAVTHEFPTRIPPHQWIAALQSGTEEDIKGRTMLWLLARVLELRFTPTLDTRLDERVEGLRGVSAEIDEWLDGLPSTSRGVSTGQIFDDGLTKVWFCMPSAGTQMINPSSIRDGTDTIPDY